MKTVKEQRVLTADLRANLKTLFANELNNLPSYLQELPTKERLDYLLKLMPFVFPKVHNVTHQTGEPGEWKLNEYHY